MKDRGGQLLSDNFYWLAAKSPIDLARVESLPTTRLNAVVRTERRGEETVASVTVNNPTDRLAFFVHLVLTKGPGGEEILPVWWDDNYFSLLPGQSRQIAARFATADLGSAPAATAPGSPRRGGDSGNPCRSSARGARPR